MHVVLRSTLLPALVALLACTGAASVVPSGPQAPVAAATIDVAVAPANLLMAAGATAQFVASVTGSADTSVTWSVQEGDVAGTIDASGVYTAPSSAGTYHVVATSRADGSRQAYAAVVVTAPAAQTVGVAVAPVSVTVSACQSVTLAATVSGSSNQAVTWSILEGPSGGVVSAQGVYTAPATAGTFHAVATSSADATKSGSATIVVSEKIVSISVTPSTVTVQPGQAVQFTATVTTTCGSFQTSTVAPS